jgi:hypothetical protein
VFAKVDSSIFDGCENIEDFENLPEHHEDFHDICRKIYYKVLEEIEEANLSSG